MAGASVVFWLSEEDEQRLEMALFDVNGHLRFCP
jgi:hypothetical protein